LAAEAPSVEKIKAETAASAFFIAIVPIPQSSSAYKSTAESARVGLGQSTPNAFAARILFCRRVEIWPLTSSELAEGLTASPPSLAWYVLLIGKPVPTFPEALPFFPLAVPAQRRLDVRSFLFSRRQLDRLRRVLLRRRPARQRH
jgi:hypothetical protein